MLKNYLFQAFRRVLKDKTYSILNILGLAASLTCFAFISLWVSDELSYDKFNQNYERIVRVKGSTKTETGITQSALTSAPMAKALKDDYAEVDDVVRFDMREEIVLHENKQTLQSGILLTEPSFFHIFNYHLIKGDETTALLQPYSVILTESTAKKYFGNTDAVGQSLTLFMNDSTNRGADYKITGIIPDPPRNAHFTFDMLASFKTIEVAHPDVLTLDGWGDASYYTYLLLKPGINKKLFSNKISQFYAKYVGDRYNTWHSIYSYSIQPLGDIHLRSHLQNEIAVNGNITQVYIFSIIGICILLLAGINYTNLSTARSAARAKEVGIKKLVGAGKNQLVFQYLSESVLLTLMALVVALSLSFYIKPFFFELTGKNVSLYSSPMLLLFIIATSIFLGVVSGIYPAFVLSAFKPVTVLKGAFKSGSKGVALRKSLVVSQFVITVILVTGIVVIYSQMAYMKNKDLGYNKDALLYIAVNGNTDVINKYPSFQNELSSSPLINGMARSNSMIVSGLGRGGAATIDRNGNPLQVNTSRLRVDSNYLRVYGLTLVAGTNFSRGTGANPTLQVILNETAVKTFGWQNASAAIGKPFMMGDQKGIITGVVRNFHFNSLQSEIEPLAIYPVSARFSKITLNIDMRKAEESLALIEQTWKKYFGGALFDYGFVDAALARQYLAEQRFSKVFMYFSVMALLIACLGLYGLVAFTTLQKTKEIGIRKVLGASANGIAVLLSTDFLKLVALSCCVAVPLTWYIMHIWLQEFAYRISITWWMLGFPVILVLFIAIATVSVHTIKAALVSPIKSLRTE